MPRGSVKCRGLLHRSMPPPMLERALSGDLNFGALKMETQWASRKIRVVWSIYTNGVVRVRSYCRNLKWHGSCR